MRSWMQQEEVALQPTIGVGEVLVLDLLQLALGDRLLLELLDLGEQGVLDHLVGHAVGELGADFHHAVEPHGPDVGVGLAGGDLLVLDQALVEASGSSLRMPVEHVQWRPVGVLEAHVRQRI
jgi:hypothetical protein